MRGSIEPAPNERIGMTFRKLLIGGAALALVLLGPAAGVASAKSTPSGSPCDSGELAPGTYSSITVTGFCMFDAGTIVINGDLTLAPNAGVDATNCDLHLTITGRVTVGEGALLGLGGSEETECSGPTGTVVGS